MEDRRQITRIQAFIEGGERIACKDKWQNFLVSLRKKNKQQMFKRKRKQLYQQYSQTVVIDELLNKLNVVKSDDIHQTLEFLK